MNRLFAVSPGQQSSSCCHRPAAVSRNFDFRQSRPIVLASRIVVGACRIEEPQIVGLTAALLSFCAPFLFVARTTAGRDSVCPRERLIAVEGAGQPPGGDERAARTGEQVQCGNWGVLSSPGLPGKSTRYRARRSRSEPASGPEIQHRSPRLAGNCRERFSTKNL